MESPWSLLFKTAITFDILIYAGGGLGCQRKFVIWVVNQIPCDQGDSRNMLWRFERFNKNRKMGSVFWEGLGRNKNDIIRMGVKLWYNTECVNRRFMQWNVKFFMFIWKNLHLAEKFTRAAPTNIIRYAFPMSPSPNNY